MKRNSKPNVPPMEVEITLDLPRRSGGKVGSGEVARPAASPRTQRVTRLMALAVKYQGLVDCGELRDYADIARLGYVTRARMTQVMNLSNLAPDIQEQLLFPSGFLPPERGLRKLAGQVDWEVQRRMWRNLLAEPKNDAIPLVSIDQAGQFAQKYTAT
jgi:hypothetical protein